MNTVHAKTDWWYINSLDVTMFHFNENLMLVSYRYLYISSNTWQAHERSFVDQQQSTAYSLKSSAVVDVCLSKIANSQHSWLTFSLQVFKFA